MDLPADWKFKTDPQNRGGNEQWFAADFDDSDWDTLQIGQDQFWDIQGYRDYDGIAWYRRKIELPAAALEGEPVLVAFGAVDETAMVYIDGELAGVHDIGPLGWDKRFVLDLTEHVKPGMEQTWAIRVLDSDRAGGIWKPVKVMTPRAKGQTHVLTLMPTADAWIRRNFPDQPYGKGPSLAVGSDDVFRSLIAWELPEALQAARIVTAKIVLTLRYVSGPGSYVLQPLPANWQERTVTWNQRDAEHPWLLAELNPPQPVIATFSFDRGMASRDVDEMNTPPVVEIDVSAYVFARDASNSRFSVMFRQDPQDPEANFSPHAREAEDENVRPKLVVEYALE